MKIKYSFVTNSSSSSFIVAYPQIIIDKDHLSKFLQTSDFNTDLIWQQTFTQKELFSKYLPKKIKLNNRVVSLMFDEMKKSQCWYGMHHPDFSDFVKEYAKRYNFEDYRIIYDNNSFYESAQTEYYYFFTNFLINKIKIFIDDYKGKYMYFYTFDDSHLSYIEVESGKAFRNVPHIKINQH